MFLSAGSHTIPMAVDVGALVSTSDAFSIKVRAKI
jgi:hypothetical protein